jgi:hypothetical protein
MVRKLVGNELDRIAVSYNRGSIPEFAWRTEENYEQSVSTDGVPEEIQTELFPNSNTQRYRFTNLLGDIHIPIARHRLGKHIPAEANARNRTSTARQRISKQAFSNKACFLRGPCKVVIKKSSVEENGVEFREASRPGYELASRGIEFESSLRNW